MKYKVPKFVYRFLPIHRLLEIIDKNEMTFNRSKTWEDPLEGYFVKKYIELEKAEGDPWLKDKEYSNFESPKYFLCCTKNSERDYQWRYYTQNKEGVRLKLSVSDLLDIGEKMGMRVDKIKYFKIKDFLKELQRFRKSSSQVINDLFFYKRYEFNDEREIRFLIQTGYGSNFLPVKIDPGKIIKELLFDPRMPSRLFEVFAAFVLKKWPKIKIEHSNLYDPDRSIKYIEK